MRLEPSDTRRLARWRVLVASLAGLACILAYAALIVDMPGIAQPLPALIGVFLRPMHRLWLALPSQPFACRSWRWRVSGVSTYGTKLAI